MTKRILIAAFSLAFFLNPPLALADSDHSSPSGASATATASPVVTNVNTATGGAGGKGGEAEASNVNVISNKAEGGNATIAKGAVDIDTKNLNTNFSLTHVDTDVTNKQHQDQDQEQKQHQSQSSYNGQSQGIDGSANNSVSINYQRNVASAQAAAAIVAACGDKTLGAAAQGPGFGGSLSLPFGTNCKTLAVAAFIQTLGHGDAALRYLCREDDDVAEDKQLCAAEPAN